MSQLNVLETEFQSRLHGALEIVRPKLEALTKNELLRVNLEPTKVVSTIRGALPRLRQYRKKIAEYCPRFNLADLDNLELYSAALLQANAICSSIAAHSKALVDLPLETGDARTSLLRDVDNLVGHGYLAAETLVSLKGPNGHRNIASDVLTLVEVLRNAWPEVTGKVCVTEAALDRAASLADEVIGQIEIAKKATAPSVEAALRRQQAFTLTVGAYDEVRRVICYLRWNDGDADRIAPSLYRKQNAPKKQAANDNTVAVAAPGATGAGSTLTAAAAEPLLDTTNAAEVIVKPRVGLPGSDPFDP
jgi:hypothetical protein